MVYFDVIHKLFACSSFSFYYDYTLFGYYFFNYIAFFTQICRLYTQKTLRIFIYFSFLIVECEFQAHVKTVFPYALYNFSQLIKKIFFVILGKFNQPSKNRI